MNIELNSLLQAINMNVIILTTVLVLFPQTAQPIAEFTKIECENHDPDIIDILNCRIARNSKNISGVFAEGKLARDVTNLNGILQMEIELGNKPINYTTHNVNFCDALHLAHSQPLVKMVFTGLRHFSNFPLDCPLKKHVLYQVNGFVIDLKLIPIYVSQVPFRTDATFFFNQRKLVHIKVFGVIGRK